MPVFQIQSCSQGVDCLNSLETLGMGSAKCGICRFAPNEGSCHTNYWKPVDGKRPHPAAVAEKAAKKAAKKAEAKQKKLSVDRGKRKILVQAEKAERLTERNMIKSTRNSGRSNRDGDHVAVGQITLDTKLQTQREHPVVLLDQLFKVRDDARRSGHTFGALVLRNKNNVGVVAIHEDDFARLIAQIMD